MLGGTTMMDIASSRRTTAPAVNARETAFSRGGKKPVDRDVCRERQCRRTAGNTVHSKLVAVEGPTILRNVI